MEASYFSW